MKGEVEVTLKEFMSASGYAVSWNSIDAAVRTEYLDDEELKTFRLQPGDYFYASWYMSDDDERVVLIRVPDDEYGFAEFCNRARRVRGPIDPAFMDSWILEYAVKTWDLTDLNVGQYPCNLEEAIQMYMWPTT